jgi:hypothetical protein
MAAPPAPLARDVRCIKVHGVSGEQLMTKATSGGAADPSRITIAPEGRSWAVKHNGGFLGHVANEREALGIAEQLVAWLEDQGRSVEFAREDRAHCDHLSIVSRAPCAVADGVVEVWPLQET